MERQLATIQRVLEIRPVPNADAIELVRIKGWQCVTRKGEFCVGDLGVFLEIDAIPPDAEAFRFLWQPKLLSGRRRRCTVAAASGEIPHSHDETAGHVVAGVVHAAGRLFPGRRARRRGRNGAFGRGKIRAASADRYGRPPRAVSTPGPKDGRGARQSFPQVLDELRGARMSSRSSTTARPRRSASTRDGEFHVCGRSMSIKAGENIYWRVARKHDLEPALRRRPSLAIQGEVVGPGIQKNRLGLKETSLFGFSVFNVSAACYLDHDAARAVLAEIGVPAVEVLEQGPSFQHTQETLLASAQGTYPGTQNGARAWWSARAARCSVRS